MMADYDDAIKKLESVEIRRELNIEKDQGDDG